MDHFEFPINEQGSNLEVAVEQLLEDGYAIRDFLEVFQEKVAAIIEDVPLEPDESDLYNRLAAALAVAKCCADTLDI